MLSLTAGLVTGVAVLIAVPVSVYVLEVAAAMLLGSRRQTPPEQEPRPRVAVLVPAHNESASLLPTIADIRAQLREGDRVLVVADNCTDDTAAVAASAGAEVAERKDPDKIGKGYALQWGLDHLADRPPEILITVDADCRLAEGALDRLASLSMRTGRPTQSLYLMNLPHEADIRYRVSALAWRIKNWVRPLGLWSLGLPCPLMGSGMAFPWPLIRSVRLASGAVVEDMVLGLDLALAGRAPLFCPAACVTSQFPTSAAAGERQRYRWEHGHMETILTRFPQLARVAITRWDIELLALALDLAVPPLMLLTLLVGLSLILGAVGLWLTGSPIGLCVSIMSAAALLLATLVCWSLVARDVLPARSMWLIVPYLFQKLGLYWSFIVGRRVSRWVRTDRN